MGPGGYLESLDTFEEFDKERWLFVVSVCRTGYVNFGDGKRMTISDHEQGYLCLPKANEYNVKS
jgi:hypothetical protein